MLKVVCEDRSGLALEDAIRLSRLPVHRLVLRGPTTSSSRSGSPSAGQARSTTPTRSCSARSKSFRSLHVGEEAMAVLHRATSRLHGGRAGLVSVVSFYIINLPPGSWVETYAIQLDSAGSPASAAQLAYITERYGLDRPLRAVSALDRPDRHAGRLRLLLRMAAAGLGAGRRPALLTIIVSLASLVFVYAVSIPVALLFGDAPVFRLRLFLLLPRHHRARDAELPSRPRPPRHLRPRLRRHADRPVLAGISRRRPGSSTSGSI